MRDRERQRETHREADNAHAAEYAETQVEYDLASARSLGLGQRPEVPARGAGSERIWETGGAVA